MQAEDTGANQEPAKWKKTLIYLWKEWGISILIAVLLATSFKSSLVDWNTVPTGSMKPTIIEGDRILVNKLAYDFKIPYTTWHLAQWGDPERGYRGILFPRKR
jgi:signal peptidase I